MCFFYVEADKVRRKINREKIFFCVILDEVRALASHFLCHTQRRSRY